jgi:putative ABC transport system permease protein
VVAQAPADLDLAGGALGVAFMAGTLVLSDTVNRVFRDLFADAYEHIDAQVRGTELFASQIGPTHRNPLDESLLEEVRAVEGVVAPSRG